VLLVSCYSVSVDIPCSYSIDPTSFHYPCMLITTFEPVTLYEPCAPTLQETTISPAPFTPCAPVILGTPATASTASMPPVPQPSAMVQCTWDPNALQTTTTVQDSPPPTYSSVAECSELTMAHFRFPHEASSLLEQNGCRIKVCEHVHAALQLES